MRHLTSCLVVTAPGDPCGDVARAVPGVGVFETDAFTRHGARFNKGLAMSEGLDVLAPDGWCLIHDADILFPDVLPLDRLRPDTLHGARRRVLDDPAKWHPGLDWNTCPVWRDGGPIGFFQCWHAADPAVKGKRPLYDVSFGHAGGADAAFLARWPRQKLTVLPLEVLHLGPTDSHWFGCDPAAVDLMARFVTENGWRRAASKFTPEQVARAGEVPHRVDVPGYGISDFDLPFVRRARQGR